MRGALRKPRAVHSQHSRARFFFPLLSHLQQTDTEMLLFFLPEKCTCATDACLFLLCFFCGISSVIGKIFFYSFICVFVCIHVGVGEGAGVGEGVGVGALGVWLWVGAAVRRWLCVGVHRPKDT